MLLNNNHLRFFRSFAVQPLTFDESLSYLEYLAKLHNHINHICDHFNAFFTNFDQFYGRLEKALINHINCEIEQAVKKINTDYTSILEQVNVLVQTTIPNLEDEIQAETITREQGDSILQGYIDTINIQITNLNSEVTNIVNVTIPNLQKQITDNLNNQTTENNNLQSQITSNTNNISSLQSSVQTLQNTVSANGISISNLSNNLALQTTRINTIESVLGTLDPSLPFPDIADDLLNLMQRMLAVENVNSTQSNNISNNASAIASLTTLVNTKTTLYYQVYRSTDGTNYTYLAFVSFYINTTDIMSYIIGQVTDMSSFTIKETDLFYNGATGKIDNLISKFVGWYNKTGTDVFVSLVDGFTIASNGVDNINGNKLVISSSTFEAIYFDGNYSYLFVMVEPTNSNRILIVSTRSGGADPTGVRTFTSNMLVYGVDIFPALSGDFANSYNMIFIMDGGIDARFSARYYTCDSTSYSYTISNTKIPLDFNSQLVSLGASALTGVNGSGLINLPPAQPSSPIKHEITLNTCGITLTDGTSTSTYDANCSLKFLGYGGVNIYYFTLEIVINSFYHVVSDSLNKATYFTALFTVDGGNANTISGTKEAWLIEQAMIANNISDGTHNIVVKLGNYAIISTGTNYYTKASFLAGANAGQYILCTVTKSGNTFSYSPINTNNFNVAIYDGITTTLGATFSLNDTIKI